MKKNLIITIGPPGAGKSTWATANLGPTTLRIERDRMREALFGGRRAYHDSPLSPHERSYVIGSAMFAAMQAWPYPTVAMTDTGLFWNSVKRFVEISGAVSLVIFNTPDHILRERNLTRPEDERVPADILEDMIQKFHDPEAWWKTSNYNRLEINNDHHS